MRGQSPSVWPGLLFTAGQQQAIDFNINLHCHQSKHKTLNRCISSLQMDSCTGQGFVSWFVWPGVFLFLISSMFHPAQKAGEKSTFGFGISIWTWVTGLLGTKCERICQKLSDGTSVSYGSVVKPCSGVILFLLCLWLFINPTCIKCTWSHAGPLTSQSYSSKFIHKETLKADLI